MAEKFSKNLSLKRKRHVTASVLLSLGMAVSGPDTMSRSSTMQDVTNDVRDSVKSVLEDQEKQEFQHQINLLKQKIDSVADFLQIEDITRYSKKRSETEISQVVEAISEQVALLGQQHMHHPDRLQELENLEGAVPLIFLEKGLKMMDFYLENSNNIDASYFEDVISFFELYYIGFAEAVRILGVDSFHSDYQKAENNFRGRLESIKPFVYFYIAQKYFDNAIYHPATSGNLIDIALREIEIARKEGYIIPQLLDLEKKCLEKRSEVLLKYAIDRFQRVDYGNKFYLVEGNFKEDDALFKSVMKTVEGAKVEEANIQELKKSFYRAESKYYMANISFNFRVNLEISLDPMNISSLRFLLNELEVAKAKGFVRDQANFLSHDLWYEYHQKTLSLIRIHQGIVTINNILAQNSVTLEDFEVVKKIMEKSEILPFSMYDKVREKFFTLIGNSKKSQEYFDFLSNVKQKAFVMETILGYLSLKKFDEAFHLIRKFPDRSFPLLYSRFEIALEKDQIDGKPVLVSEKYKVFREELSKMKGGY